MFVFIGQRKLEIEASLLLIQTTDYFIFLYNLSFCEYITTILELLQIRHFIQQQEKKLNLKQLTLSITGMNLSEVV